ncbi:hypothetical protein A3D00_00140 [Candidatus Woesebacteria bacterium RIFCSPHIGHO2_02_FULL_38_9]|nr:MAG: hypothetical protein A3D00_00140 [Candidatus Woesebacteria bacterium RIFCSPHIGHO2_02_FULL_38_9]OGM57851.1 MAG: hypothetical protein A3A50_02450 [Candidatus Woesebacteria bacterium RIFCSPLOWO2_01_FULL_38_20]
MFKLKKPSFFSIFVVISNFLLILFLYKSVFSLQVQGDTWQYAFNQEVRYGNSLFTSDSLRALRTSLGGSYLTFSLIKLTFGLNSLVFYTISVILKFISVVAVYLFIKKLTQNRIVGFLCSLLLSASYVGIEATHWVFNMYAYVGLIFIVLGMTIALDLPKKFDLRRWFFSFGLVSIGIWFASMRTNGIILIILLWSLIKVFLLKSDSSRKNFFHWLLGFIVLFLVYKNILGLFERDYSNYIWSQWWSAFGQYLKINKYDFLLSPIANVGHVITPDSWVSSLNLYQRFYPIFGPTKFKAIIFPSFLIFVAVSWLLSKLFSKKRKVFSLTLFLGVFWTALTTLIYKSGPANFPSSDELIFTILGWYFLSWSLSFFLVMPKKGNAFFFAFFWAFSFMLVPIVLNQGNIFGTLHRYFVTTSVALPLFFSGILALALSDRRKIVKLIILSFFLSVVFLNGFYTKSFFDYESKLHNRALAARIWKEFTQIVPNDQKYVNNPPTLWLEAKNNLDRGILLESLQFGLDQRLGYIYHWEPNNMNNLYNDNYNLLVSNARKNPKILENFYAIRLENGSLKDISNEVKDDLLKRI